MAAQRKRTRVSTQTTETLLRCCGAAPTVEISVLYSMNVLVLTVNPVIIFSAFDKLCVAKLPNLEIFMAGPCVLVRLIRKISELHLLDLLSFTHLVASFPNCHGDF